MTSSPSMPPVTRRSFSLPAARPPSNPDPQIEVLYILPSTRIISFNTARPTARPSSNNGGPMVEDEPGTLSWVSRFERTIAVGPLRIYRAPGSVAFLNCADALRPILPKSQAWCVDGNSKFVLQIRRPQYWRIEVPNKTAEEKFAVEELKRVLGAVLRFEKTPCPFQRDFTVELPESPKTPIKKKAWKPVERSGFDKLPTPEARTAEDVYQNRNLTSGNRASSPSPLRPTTSTTATGWNSAYDFAALPSETAGNRSGSLSQLSDTISLSSTSPTSDLLEEPPLHDPVREQKDEPSPTADALEPLKLDQPHSESIFTDLAELGDDGDSYSDATDDTNTTPRSQFQPAYQPLIFEPETYEKPQAIQNCSRFITAPPILSLVTSPPSKHRTSSPLRCSTVDESADSDFSSSVESFYSVQSWHSPLAPPSPPSSGPSSPTQTYPYPHNNIDLPKQAHHARDTSEVTVPPETPRAWDITSTPDLKSIRRGSSPPPKTPTLIKDASEHSDEELCDAITPPTVRQDIRHRATTSSNSRRRELSPLPAVVNLFSPPRRGSRRLQTGRHLPTAIIQKTCEILLSPPSHLLHLMLNIASKIAAGEWRGFLSGHGESVHWDFEDEYGGEGCFEDDYGISLPRVAIEAKNTTAKPTGGSWEVD